MKNRLLHKVKQNKAFTLLETLIAVAVMVVLLGISVLGITNLTTGLKMAELDEYAKIVYLEAQNQLGIMEVEGALGAYHKEIRETYPAGNVKENLRFLKAIYADGEKPEGYPEDAEKMWEQMCYLKKSDTLSAKMISFTSDIYNNGGSYLIEFNPQTGDIYSVFYWESDEELTYDDILALNSRDRADRTSARIGYYGGTIAGDLTEGSELEMDATLVNGEELYLKVSFANTEELLSFYYTALDIKVTIQGEKGNVVTIEHMDLSNVVQTLDNLEFYLLLDSMQEGLHFDDIVNAGLSDDQKIIPGENLSIKVDCYFKHESGLWKSKEDIVGNSLFGYDTDENTITISSVRHLMNLNEQYFDNALFLNAKNEIQFISNVDFNESAYAWKKDAFGNPKYVGYGKAERPISGFAPITNASLLKNSAVNGKDAGTKYVLQNFNIVAPQKENAADEKNAGLFSAVENVQFSNIHLVDVKVDAGDYSNVGALVGSMKGGSISGCGVYLSTEGVVGGVITDYCKMDDSSDCNHANKMEHRYDTYKVIGGANVGGLVGLVSGMDGAETIITDAFAAVKVEASGNAAGGFAGAVKNAAGNSKVTIRNTYASGNVVGDQKVGGFAGSVSANEKNIVLSDLYTTGNVYADQYFGGFLGESYNASYKNCTSYGHVYNAEVLTTGIDALAAADCVGGFVSKESSAWNDYVNCIYMIQNGYNTEKAIADSETIIKKSYGDLLAGATLFAEPYSVDLHLQAFPFAALPNQVAHYGDWAEPFVIDTSLVYYEKYADSSYGYYCVTTISDSNNIWVLNTLKDKECIEDGYGLLTKYNLEKIDYDLYVGTGDTITSSKDNVGIVTQSMVDAGTSSNGKFIRLNQQGSLKFYAVESYDEVYGKEGAKTGESFEVSKLYLYQLPYELQCTNRMNVSYFYDRIQITAKAYGSDTKVINGLSYLYCPHFARTAVNPNVNEIEPVVDYQAKHENPLNIFIRSAKQLNALGRFPYYWNERGGLVGGQKVTYIQETDINFSTYVKTYAGRDFDLQAFGKVYSNRPIGDPDLAPNESQYFNAQFRNTYDGRSNKIIDYCVEGSWIEEGTGVSHYTQFTGLFGEINDATLKNIVMVVSDNPAHENAGMITSSFLIDNSTSKRPWEGDSVKRAGVGALVGLAYETNRTSNTIENCVASGYTVQYKMRAEYKERDAQPLGIAVGGLAGFSMSDMSNCAATNDVVMNMERDYIFEKQGTVFLGGFVGSYFYGTIRDCYSGGTISVVDNDNDKANFKYAIARLRVGAFCPGWMDTPASGLEWNDHNVVYLGVYSLTDVSDDIWKVREGANSNSSKFDHYIPLVSRMVVCEDDTLGLIGDWIWGKRWTTDDIEGMDVRAVGTYHVSDLVDKHLSRIDCDNDEAPKKYFSEIKNFWGVVETGRTSAPITIANLKKITEANTNGTIYTLANRADVSYVSADSGASLVNYPFPEVIYEVDANGNKTGKFVHYGEWPGEISSAIKNFLTYYEKYADGTYEFYYVKADGTIVDSLVKDGSKEIVETGYGVLTIDKASANAPQVTKSIVGNDNGDSFTYYLNTFDAEFLFAELGNGLANNGKNLAALSFKYDYTKVEIVNGILNLDGETTLSSKTYYVNPFYGAALSASNNLGTTQDPLQVRTAWQLSNVGNTNVTGAMIAQTYNIDLKAGNSPVDVNKGVTFNGNADKGIFIKNATATVFGTNDGTITNTRVDAAVVVADKAYGFVVENKGAITYSIVTGSVTGKTEAAGFVGNNTGTISNSYVNAQVSATEENATTIAAGFAIHSANTEKCYAVGTVNATDTYGFMRSGKANTCYTIVNQVSPNAENMYGFAGNSDVATATNCYWGYDSFANHNVAAAKANKGVGNRVKLSAIQNLSDYATDYADVPNNTALGTNCPYPSAGLVHYGDWPVTSRFNNAISSDLNSSNSHTGIFYYEMYKDEVDGTITYGIYAEGYSGRTDNSVDTTINTLLQTSGYTPVEKGFGIYVKQNNWEIKWGSDQYQDMVNVGTVIDYSVNGYQFRKLTDTQNSSLNLDIRYYYNRITINNKTLSLSLEKAEAAR